MSSFLLVGATDDFSQKKLFSIISYYFKWCGQQITLYNTSTLNKCWVCRRVEVIESEQKYFSLAGQHLTELMQSEPLGRGWRYVLSHCKNIIYGANTKKKRFGRIEQNTNREQSIASKCHTSFTIDQSMLCAVSFQLDIRAFSSNVKKLNWKN